MKINVPHVAKLANIPLSSNEIPKFEKQLDETIEYVDELKKIGTKNVSTTSQVTELENVTRDDSPSSERILSQEEALSNTKSKQNGLFKVKGVFNE